jgi:hypothetical protein
MPNSREVAEQQPSKDWYQRIGDRRGHMLILEEDSAGAPHRRAARRVATGRRLSLAISARGTNYWVGYSERSDILRVRIITVLSRAAFAAALKRLEHQDGHHSIACWYWKYEPLAD